MPNRPLVSVVTPTLNQAVFLESTLGSVLAQTYPNVEHIVVDGGSTDGTLELLNKARDAGTVRFISEPDGGMYEAINKGLAMAKGEVLAYLNSDDAYLPWAIETVMQVFESRPEVDFVYGDGVKVEDGTGVQRLRLFPPFDRVSLANYESLMQPAVFWGRALSERLGGFDRDMRFVADLDFWLRASAAGATIVHVDEVIAIERIHPSRLSAASKDAMAEEDRSMRAHHAGDAGGPAGREKAKQRDMAWQRRLLRRFAYAAMLRRLPFRLPGPWPHFLYEGGTKVRWRRVLAAAEPNQQKLLRNAVVSALAAETLSTTLADLAPGKDLILDGRPKRRFKRLRRLARRTIKAARAVPRTVRYHWREAELALTYRFSAEGRRSRARLAALRDTAATRRCVIIGNGPSLNRMDLSVLRDEVTFGLNRGYLLFPRIGGPTTYLVSANRYVLEQSMDEMLAAPSPKFFNWRHRRFVPEGRDDVIFVHTVHKPGFSHDLPGRGLWEGATVTFVAMQLALHIGYREVVLIGVDHSFTTPGPAHQLVTSAGADPNHFDPSYFGKGYRWQLPDLEMSEQAYRLAKAAFEAAGGSIVDATVDGKLTIFPKAEFAALFPVATAPAGSTTTDGSSGRGAAGAAGPTDETDGSNGPGAAGPTDETHAS
ncbi:MAG TPA: glycosyltransferase family 2 protein, partial [Candidatus Binatia bacterium]|nr:glycosyltransferase family 2 protein [Candidatus Binatia bacterium]